MPVWILVKKCHVNESANVHHLCQCSPIHIHLSFKESYSHSRWLLGIVSWDMDIRYYLHLRIEINISCQKKHNLKDFSKFLGFAIICQLTTLLYPSREPTMLYICFGKFPKKFLNQKVKSNTSFNIVAILAVTMHVALSIRNLVYKIQEKKDLSQQQNENFSFKTYFKDKLNSESLFRWKFSLWSMLGPSRYTNNFQEI